jgi:hypothetical protein
MPLSKWQVTQALRRYRYDPEWAYKPSENSIRLRKAKPVAYKTETRHGYSTVPLKSLAALAGVEWYEARHAQCGVMGNTTRDRLSHVIELIEAGRLKINKKWGVGVGSSWEVEYIEPPSRRPPPQDRLHRAEDYREWAPCRTCQGDKWMPVEVNRAIHYACKQCWPDGNLAAIGARKLDPKDVALSQPKMREDFRQF